VVYPPKMLENEINEHVVYAPEDFDGFPLLSFLCILIQSTIQMQYGHICCQAVVLPYLISVVAHYQSLMSCCALFQQDCINA